MPREKQLRYILILGILLFIAMTVYSLHTKVFGFIPDHIIFIALIIFLYFTYDFWNLSLPVYIFIIIGLWLHSAGTFGWYNISPVLIQWDHITHFFGIIPFAMMFFRFLAKYMAKRTKNISCTKKQLAKQQANCLAIFILVLLLSLGVGTIVELSEFFGYLFVGYGDGVFMFGPGDGVAGKTGSDLMDVLGGGWINEGWDMVFNLLGAVTGVIIMIIIQFYKRV